MIRPPRIPLVICLLLALAACSSTGQRGPHSTAADKAAAAQAARDPSTAEAPLPASPLSRSVSRLAEGDQLQAQGRCRDALQPYGLAALEPGPGRGQALAAIYLCYWQLQRPKAAEESFTLWLRHELDQGRLPLLLLFQPGETRYLVEPRVSAPYSSWLRRIAEASLSAHHCLTLHGHAGPSAVEQYANDLALRRAQAVQHQLETLAPALKGRVRSKAAVTDDAVVGSASDDLRDALDRRVEFAIGAC